MQHVPQLLEKAIRLNRMQAPFLNGVVERLTEHDRNELDRYIAYCLAGGADLDFLAQSYDLIVKDTLREQIYFQRHKRYRFSSYDEVASSVYMNPEYMSKYMHGLALTSFLWPNHAAMKKYFLETIPQDREGRYLEIGPGHGFYLMSAMRSTRFTRFEGVDLSPTSVQMTRAILSSSVFGNFSNYDVYECNFLDAAFEHRYDAIVMGEVLEHVENPVAFLEKIRATASDDAYVFITTCINSPAFDHIYLFESVEHLESVIGASGLGIADKLVLPYVGKTLEESMSAALPVNVAYVLRRNA